MRRRREEKLWGRCLTRLLYGVSCIVLYLAGDHLEDKTIHMSNHTSNTTTHHVEGGGMQHVSLIAKGGFMKTSLYTFDGYSTNLSQRYVYNTCMHLSLSVSEKAASE